MIYLYALCETDFFPFPKIFGLEDAIVRSVPLGDVTLAVSDTTSTPAYELSSLCQHEAVVERLSATRPILPFRFGTAVSDLERLAGAIRSRLTAILANLDRVTGCVELGLSAVPSTHLHHGAADVHPPQSSQPGQAYLEKLRRAEARRAAEARKLRTRVEGLNVRLQKLSRCSHVIRSEQPELPLRFAYLVPWNAMPAFRSEVKAAQSEAGMPALLASGPWPPYSFVKSGLLEFETGGSRQ
ncbi:GvpL/GvpF family gas vesicle protein [Algihabitans albus]|uniref:GvpL/GvpF family gas vesicle protein n=1 Tax=Algihabitans albus TaxID=2164067 RepID=UPI0013C35F69|nr:GvpL/GvpF family gas vesicle protein [Algihabitans albus]